MKKSVPSSPNIQPTESPHVTLDFFETPRLDLGPFSLGVWKSKRAHLGMKHQRHRFCLPPMSSRASKSLAASPKEVAQKAGA